MNAPFDTRLDKAAFNDWLGRAQRKHEWKEGCVVQMPNVTKAHARIVSNFVFHLRVRLDPARWSVTASDLGVEKDTFVRFPDVIVEPMDRDDKGRRAQEPSLIVEVLSPSSVGTDLIEKPAEYFSLPTLEAYVAASQDEPILWVWQRGADRAIPARAEEIRGRSQSLTLRALGIAMPLAEIYGGVAEAGP